ncbi:hypothetical protein [Denitromonas halophila]|uniref:Uncharacterized protein n=1 Tax=Denitromonas halophila TaxID=1629404 RepID=A0A557R2U4_9RHOO|nr:hypothetical protein [Denitromonas halophila]TVO59462.1 hypothetical protein FHP91_01755 [Denitromonas halophila]
MCTLTKRIVDASGTALEFEDRYLLGAVTANRIAYDGESGGILRINNERYYQFVVARALMSSMPYKVKIEVDGHDLVLEDPVTKERIVVIEMKRWMSASGKQELGGIRKDLGTKLPAATAKLKIMLLFSSNPPGLMKQQIDWLSSQLNTRQEHWESHCFSTFDPNGKSVEFWTAGYTVIEPPPLPRPCC